MGEMLFSIRNISSAMEGSFKNTEIKDVETLRTSGADEDYRRLLNSAVKNQLIAYYLSVTVARVLNKIAVIKRKNAKE